MERTRCEVYTRCMGYFRPTSAYNDWKKAEFYSRKYFNEKKTLDSFNKAFNVDNA